MKQEAKKNENAELVKMMQGLYENQLVLAESMGVSLPFSIDEWQGNINKVCEPLEVREVELPLKLARRIRNKGAWDLAVNNGYITMGNDGMLVSHFGTKTLLAYFLGRLFCGDIPVWSKSEECKIWKKGDGKFNGLELNRLFMNNNLKELRGRYLFKKVPNDSEYVDCLFDRPKTDKKEVKNG